MVTIRGRCRYRLQKYAEYGNNYRTKGIFSHSTLYSQFKELKEALKNEETHLKVLSKTKLKARVPGMADIFNQLMTPSRPRWPSGKVSTSGPGGCLERSVPAQVSSSSSDRGSKLRGPAQNSPRVP
ncbi:hypothetical protein AVEN_121252-1 [Araneus ventricosus]|uniref:Uncharacterized protein n=1 Tax=Araneus ventricosus TaxID=182803 RepID=A0A4Y2KY62_ARAVE|nr:hypothetical protein AVEN_121252-1 [Araneus ventricosus]